ncbi:FG-GAP-like repeat-containing protein [Hymenobacter properus]|uniref:VCBS repeat-containing protein n=1 Tax=Hymenobacter properus TaxID=2791026 RepID=A0A931BCG7_9BACT|nr:FG-GAP-like repeat-containing protein [Hymenobacter properus]MBF9140138.1 VCBS repeat-containing protein [Hymenobacter properus]MBR7718945.1 VCBS repeat-containing protein [Microvirga sp. SRT04]
MVLPGGAFGFKDKITRFMPLHLPELQMLLPSMTHFSQRPFHYLLLAGCFGSTVTMAQSPAVVSAGLSPARNAVAAPRTAPVVIPFSQTLNPSTADNIKIHASQSRGRRTATVSTSGSIVTLTPTTPAGQAAAFSPGETVTVTVPATVQSTAGAGAVPQVYQFTAAATGGSGNFGPGSDVATNTTGYGPDVKAGDLDGDGDIDFVTNSQGTSFSADNKIKVRLNDGSGNFSPAPDVIVDYAPNGVALADVDGDGDLDIVAPCAGTAGSTVNICLNNGNANFAIPIVINIGLSLSNVSVALGDMDGDADLDLVINGGWISFNDGSGRFTGMVALPAAAGVMGDLDGDGDLDLMSPSRVLLNNGHGSFALGSTPSFSGPLGLTLGDLDGDGDLDAATVNFGLGSTNRVSVRLNDGNGNFSGTTEIAIGATAPCLALGDIDGDGDLDLLVPKIGSPMFMDIARNDGAGHFGGITSVPTAGPASPSGIQAMSMALADVDNDGDLDFLSSQYLGGIVGVRLNSAALATASALARPAATFYPNPAFQNISVQIRCPVPADARKASVSIFNALGQFVTSASLTVQSGLVDGPLPTTDLAPGIYNVRVQAGAVVVSKRLTVL